MQHQVAIAIGKTDFQRWLGKQSSTPGRVLLRRCGVRRIERSPLWKRVCRRNVIVGSQAATPVEGLQLATLVDAEGIGRVAAIEAEQLRGLGRARVRNQ